MGNINVLGYSERGVINSIFYEILYGDKPVEFIKNF